MKRASMLVFLCVGLLIPAEASANDGGWWDWLWQWDPKLMGVSSEIHLVCLTADGRRIRGCEEWFRKVPKALTGKEIVHEYTVLDPSGKPQPATFKDIKHEVDFRFGFMWNYGARYDPPDPPSHGSIKALRLMGAYLYRINDVVAVGGAAGYMPVWGARFPETQSRALLTANMLVYPFATHSKWRAFAIRPEFNWVPGGFTGADFGDPGVSYAKDNLTFVAVSVGVDLRRVGRYLP